MHKNPMKSILKTHYINTEIMLLSHSCPGKYIYVDRANNRKTEMNCDKCFKCRYYTFYKNKQDNPHESETSDCQFYKELCRRVI